MKPRKIIGAAAALAAAASMGSCGIFEPPQNEAPTVYGPPEWFGDTTTSSSETAKLSETSTATETSDNFRPETNEPVAVYGPPEWFETETSETEDTPEPFDPATNEPVDVYGPPEWFETEDTTVDPDTIPEEDTDITLTSDTTKAPSPGFLGGLFKPEENEPVDVYGPPEWFE